MNNTSSQTVAGLTSSEEQLNAALEKVLADYPAMSSQATTSLTWMNFLIDQVSAIVPGVHPLEVGRSLYLRLTPPTADRRAISDAFTVGSLLAVASRSRTAEFNARAEAEASAAFQHIRDNWSSYHRTESKSL